MRGLGRWLAGPAMAAMLAGGCAQAGGGIGDVLGGILNPSPSNQVSGTVSGVDTRSQVVFVNTDQGQQISLQYDNRTQVVYQGQNYPVPNLERGDQVTARIQGTTNGGYYADMIEVTRSTSNASTGGSGSNYQTLEGTVSQVNYQEGTFVLSPRSGAQVVVAMPYNARQVDVQRFNQLRSGDYVRLQGTFVAANRVQLGAFI